ncbi:hypothetical protein RND81_05G202200 [Saponaria officinalis]|uniref:CCHC-type domain-containing protein n=1 Tax=Saponaria officinalis TaxID=3572 RepID=A0AAW1KZB4_SAPOF
MSAMSRIISDLSKLEPLDGNNYKRWSQKLLMFFEQLEINYVLFKDPSKPVVLTNVETTPPVTAVVKSNEEEIKKFAKGNKTARCHLLIHMTNTLFDLFMIHKSAKVIWGSLESKYGSDDAGKKKYVVGKWLKFVMQDGKLIMEQVHIYENLCADVVNEGMKLCDVFLANVLLEKFPPSWSDYRNHRKHKKKDLSLQELVGHMRTEEANRLKDKPVSFPINTAKVNLIESSGLSYVGLSNVAKFKGKGKTRGGPGQAKNQGPSTKINGPGKHTKPVPKIQKPVGTLVCYVCGKSGHKAYQCTQKKTAEVNVVETDDIIAAVIVEANLVGNVAEWILDTGASRHFCADKGLFAEFEEVADGECVYVGNSSSAMITGKGKIFLKLTSGKTLALNNVLYVPSLRRNLVSGALLNKAGMKLVFEADKVVMSRNGEFVGKGYLSETVLSLRYDCIHGVDIAFAVIFLPRMSFLPMDMRMKFDHTIEQHIVSIQQYMDNYKRDIDPSYQPDDGTKAFTLIATLPDQGPWENVKRVLIDELFANLDSTILDLDASEKNPIPGWLTWSRVCYMLKNKARQAREVANPSTSVGEDRWVKIMGHMVRVGPSQ